MPVSYTHLDVYKRQILYYAVLSYITGNKSVEQVSRFGAWIVTRTMTTATDNNVQAM